jgi:DNA-directed RNA polymerase subunit RPC12/RpoP
MSEAESENVGIECRRCGCRHLPAYMTVRVRETIKRYRECRNCGLKITTKETFLDTVHRPEPKDFSG